MAPVTQSKGITVEAAVHLQGVKVNALIDTGASVSCINRRLYQQNQPLWGALDPVPHGVLGADGGPLRVDGVTQILEVQWGQFRSSGEFIVLSSDNTPRHDHGDGSPGALFHLN